LIDYTSDIAYTGVGSIPTTYASSSSVDGGVAWTYNQLASPDNGPFLFAVYGSTKSWTGATSTDWNTAGNWSSFSVPATSDMVTIPNTTNKPIVTGGLTIASGGSVTIAPGAALTLTGTLTNNSAGGVVIQSDATGTGSLIVNTAAGSGTTIAQSYLTTGRWHIVSSPVAQTIADFLGGNSNIPTGTGGIRGMMDYNPATNGWKSFFTNSTSGSIGGGTGYSLRSTADGIVSYTGALQAGSKTVSGLTAGSWNCVGNPYSSAIGVNSASSSSHNFISDHADNLDMTYGGIYVWDQPDANNENSAFYSTYSNASAALLVQQGQAYMVKMKPSVTSLTFTSSMQVHAPGV
jgi:hypothetical protein